MSNSPFYFPRPDILEKIHGLFAQVRIVILYGPTSCGKTTLVKEYADTFEKYYTEIVSRNFFDIPFLNMMRKKMWHDQDNKKLLVIDDYDKIFLDRDKQELLQAMHDSRYAATNILVTMTNFQEIPGMGSVGKLFIDKLTSLEIEAFLSNFLDKHELPTNLQYTLIQQTKASRGYPSDIVNLLSYFNYHQKMDVSLETSFRDSLIYDNELIKKPELITDVRIINEFMWEEIQKNPKLLYTFHPRKFEEWAADMFTKLGYSVELTPYSGDGGKDIYVAQKTHLGKLLFLVECKRNAPHNKVGVGVIDRLYGRVNHERASAGVAITTSWFTKPARDFQESVHHQINLIDYSNLCELIKQIKL